MNILSRGRIGRKIYIIREQLRRKVREVVTTPLPVPRPAMETVLADDDDFFLADDDGETFILFEG